MEFLVGQIWEITQGKYSNYRVYIHKKHELEKIGLCLNISVPDAKISHMPFSYEAMLKSNIELISEKEDLGDKWKEGYDIWKEAFDTGEAGIYSITISEALDLMFGTIATGDIVDE